MDSSSKVPVRREGGSRSVESGIRRERWFVPRADVVERADSVSLLMNLPGVEEKNLNIAVEKGKLTVTGITTPCYYDSHELVYAESGGGNFKRSFELSGELDANRISAALKNGVLRLEIAKSEEVKPRRIEVKSA